MNSDKSTETHLLTEGASLENLVVLSYAHNMCYVRVEEVVPKGIVINTLNQTWFPSEDAESPSPYVIDIGDDHIKGFLGVIGVYDRRNIEHLDSMAHIASEVTKPKRGPWA